MPRRTPAGSLACSCSAAARARGSWPTSCRRRSSARSQRCARGSSLVQQAREEDLARVRETYARLERRGRGRAVLRRSAGADRRQPSRRLALGRLDRGRACGDRPAVDPGAAAACARSGSDRQCRRAGRRPAARSACRQDEFTPERLAAEIAAACQRAAKARSNGRRPPARRARSTPPSGSPIW